MADIDREIVLWLNQFACKSALMDGGVVLLSNSKLLRGCVVVALLWWAWTRSRARLIGEELFWPRTVFGVCLALAVARLAQNALTRARPLDDASLGFRPALFYDAGPVQDWNAFPSDHAVLFVALSTAITFADRRAGWAALAWTALAILLPRVYLGLHYPSDLVGGALLGAAVMLGAQRVPVPRGLPNRLRRFEDHHRGLTHAGAFVFSFLAAGMFDDLRHLGRGIAHALAGAPVP